MVDRVLSNSCLVFQLLKKHFNLIKAGLLSRSPGRGGGGLRGPDAKNQGYDQPIEMKFRMSNYSHKSMPDAKVEYGSFSSFGDMTSSNFDIYPWIMGLT